MDNLTRSQRREIKQSRKDMEEALAHPPTRRVIAALVDATGIYDTAPEGDRDYFLGRRSVGVDLIRAMGGVDPHAYVNLMRDAANKLVEASAEQRTTERKDDDY